MLNATLHHRRSKTRPQFRVPDTQRAGAIVVSARVKLKEFADQELLHGKWTGIQAGPHKAFGRIYMKLGMVDGVGLLLKLADFKTDEKGALEPDELARFQQEGTEFIEVLQGSALNNTVLNSLMLTILVALLVLHAGDHAYVENAAPQRFGDVTSQPNGGAWSEATTFYFPLPPTATPSPHYFLLPTPLCSSGPTWPPLLRPAIRIRRRRYGGQCMCSSARSSRSPRSSRASPCGRRWACTSL